jgi:hypothetical protein
VPCGKEEVRKGGIHQRKAKLARVRGMERRRRWEREWVQQLMGSIEVL